MVEYRNDSGVVQAVTLIKQSSYTITELALNTVYTITVTAANMCRLYWNRV